MATILPFRGLLYSDITVPELGSVIAPPYDVINAELSARLRSDSHNIIHVDLPEGDSPAKYSTAATRLTEWCDEGILVRDDKPGLYVISQRYSVRGMPGKVRWGFIALLKIEDDATGVVLPHEKTLDAPRNDRIELIAATRAQISPVFVLYSDPSGGISETIESSAHRPADRLATGVDGVENRLWRLTDPTHLDRITQSLSTNKIWIADGHHRYAAARAVRDRLRIEEPGLPSGSASYDYLIVYVSNIDAVGLSILPYHRVARGDFPDAAGLAAKVKDHFESRRFSFEGFGHRGEQIRRRLQEAKERGQTAVGVYSSGPEFFVFHLKQTGESGHLLSGIPEPLRGLDVSLLHRGILEAGMGVSIEKQKAGNILGYTHEIETAIEQVDAGEAKLAFLLNPPDRRIMMSVAEAGLQMPQKSTYFYPKVPTGLVLHRFEPGEISRQPGEGEPDS